MLCQCLLFNQLVLLFGVLANLSNVIHCTQHGFLKVLTAAICFSTAIRA